MNATRAARCRMTDREPHHPLSAKPPIRESLGRLLFLLHLMVLACAFGDSRGDIIILRNGQELRGRVTIEGDKARIELDVGATLVVDRGEIARTVVEGPGQGAKEGAAEVSARLLKRLEERERIHALLEALLDDDEKVRREAEAELARAGRGALPLVREAFARARGQEKAHLLRVVAALGDVGSAPAVEAILRNPQEKDLHQEAARALVALRGPDAQWALTEVLVSTKDPSLKAQCLGLLGRLRSAYAAPFIVAALGEPTLAQRAHAALAGWRDPVVLPFLLPMLDEGSRDAREQVARLIADAVTPAHAVALGRLLDLYRGERGVAKALATGVSRLHREFPVVGDVELLGCSQDYLRKRAEEALKRRFRRRGSSPKDWADERARATAPRVVVVGVGTVGAGLLRELTTGLAASLRSPEARLRVEVSVGLAVKPVVKASGVCDGPAVLACLARRQETDYHAVRVVGVSAARVWMPGRESAMVATWPGGPVLVSLFGLGESREDVLRRGRRLALHGLARSLWVPVCGDPRCPGGHLYAVGGLDGMSSRFCSECLGRLGAVWAAEAEAAAFRYSSAARRLATAARGGSKGLLAEAAMLCERGLVASAAIERWRAFEQAGGSAAVVARRIELLDKAERWLAKRRLSVRGR